ncbi:VOC family protein, partial [Streptomyces albidoflavus]|uniref:VOC family protein n=1 Tax=Streptomyces albidoflavus TaxID=1886 RepID=UPI003529CF37
MTVRGIDHIGLTVPDLEGATRFLADALGAEVLYDTLPAHRGPVGGPAGAVGRVEPERAVGVPGHQILEGVGGPVPAPGDQRVLQPERGQGGRGADGAAAG